MEEIRHIKVFGIVQGVGFRPFVKRLGDQCGVKGNVANKGSYVEIFAQGKREQLDDFQEKINSDPPSRALVFKCESRKIESGKIGSEKVLFDSFEIIESQKELGNIFVSPDIAICEKCKEELFDEDDPRYMHPFINCTGCGPRVTILDGMPYDRERTSMGEFSMCENCYVEYHSPASRRYDAQPVCCNNCGPQVYIMADMEEDCGKKDTVKISSREAITATRKAIAEGKIVAIKGIGGFHLCCNATNSDAVERLRQLKHRPAKPFAVMMRDIETVRRECDIDLAQEYILTGHEKPIILLDKKKQGRLSSKVAPDNPKVGVMLPYAPIQLLLFDYNDGFDIGTDCLVMTSGNVSGAAICKDDEDVREQIADFCDLVLSNDRKIRLRADDSVMDFYKDKPYMIRRSRGYAPFPFEVNFNDSEKSDVLENADKNSQRIEVLGIGGELKNSFCLGKNNLFYPSPYIGDMGDYRTAEALKASLLRMEELLEIRPQAVGCDMHPGYNTSQIAKELGIPVIEIQHHFAHIVSCMAENDYTDKVIGVSMDGTGYGTDGSIWGGEIMLADCEGFKRVASIKPFLHIGGDISSKEGYRIAVSMINELYDSDEAQNIVEKLQIAPEALRGLYEKMAQKKLNSVSSTSAGRLFDGVSAVLGIRKTSSFEGEAAMSLQFEGMSYIEAALEHKKIEIDNVLVRTKESPLPEISETYSKLQRKYTTEKLYFSRDSAGFIQMNTHLLFKDLVELKIQGVESSELAYVFHAMFSDMIAESVLTISGSEGLKVCALSGGVFQNTLLLEMVEKKLHNKDIKILRHSMIPANDGGIALGQAVVTAKLLSNKSDKTCEDND